MIPLSTTTVTIERPTAGADAFEAVTYAEVAVAVPGHVSSPSGTEARGSGTQEAVSATLALVPGTDVRRQDRVTDDSTGDIWQVEWVRARQGLGLDRVVAGLNAVTGTI